MIMRQLLCLFGVLTLITLFCVMVFDFDDTLKDKIQCFCWFESIIMILFGAALCFAIMTGDIKI